MLFHLLFLEDCLFSLSKLFVAFPQPCKMGLRILLCKGSQHNTHGIVCQLVNDSIGHVFIMSYDTYISFTGYCCDFCSLDLTFLVAYQISWAGKQQYTHYCVSRLTNHHQWEYMKKIVKKLKFLDTILIVCPLLVLFLFDTGNKYFTASSPVINLLTSSMFLTDCSHLFCPVLNLKITACSLHGGFDTLLPTCICVCFVSPSWVIYVRLWYTFIFFCKCVSHLRWWDSLLLKWY